MKRILLLVSIFCAFKVSAQDYLISFAGTGASTTINSVKVENLTKGTFLTLNGSDILRLNFTTGIKTIDDNQSTELKIYPNPMINCSVLEIFPTKAGDAVITVLDITGKQVAQIQSYLENSTNNFKISGLKNGLYLVNVKGNNYQFSGKLVSNGESRGTISIEKVNVITPTVIEKTEKEDSKGTQATIDMTYTLGDRLKFTGTSGNYSTVIIDIPTTNKTITFNLIACIDGDNNNYPVVAIGTQVWMAENLKTTKYNNGDFIATTSPASLNIISESTPRYQWAYNGNENNVSVYGRLYTGYAVTDNRNICPTGWKVPSRTEWLTMSDYLGGETVTGNKLKETGQIHWSSPNTTATNETGFTALPGGFRSYNGSFEYVGEYGQFSSTTEDTLHPGNTFHCSLSNNLTNIFWWGSMYSGISVRCIKNN